MRWSVLGMGIAGRARARAIQACEGHMVVAGYRGRPEELDIPRVQSVAAALDAADAVVIATPDATHATLVEQALDAGKHVVVEFPLAQHAADARRLLDLATARERLLHVEHIELLTASTLALRQYRQEWVRGDVAFTSKPRDLPSVAHANLARIHRALDLLGPAETVTVDARTSTHLVARLHGGGRELSLHFEHADALRRNTSIRLETRDQSIHVDGRSFLVDGRDVPLETGPGLFLQDQRWAIARLNHGGPSYVSDDLLVHALAVVDTLASAPVGSAHAVPSL